MEEALYAEILVKFGPVDSLAGANETKVCPLRGRGFGQPPGPDEWHADDRPVYQVGDDFVSGDAHPLNTGIAATRSVHTMPSG